MNPNDTNRSAGAADPAAGPDAEQDLQKIQQELLSRALPPEAFLTPADVLGRIELQERAEAAGFWVEFSQPPAMPADMLREALQDLHEAGRPCPYYTAWTWQPTAGPDAEQQPRDRNAAPYADCPKQTEGNCAFLPRGKRCPWLQPSPVAIPYEKRKFGAYAVVLKSAVNAKLDDICARPESWTCEAGRYSVNFCAAVNRRGAASQTVEVTIWDAPRILTSQDITVMDAAFSLYEDGRSRFTVNELIQRIYWQKEETRDRHFDSSKEPEELVRDSLDKLNRTQIVIHAAEQQKGYPTLRSIYRGAMLQTTEKTVYFDEHGLQQDAYELGPTCPLLSYNKDLNHIGRIHYDKLTAPNAKGKPSLKKADIKRKLLDRIERARNQQKDIDVIELEHLFRELGLGGPLPGGELPFGSIKGKKATQARARIEVCLKEMQSTATHTGVIKRYEWQIAGRTYTKITLYLEPNKEQSQKETNGNDSPAANSKLPAESTQKNV